MDVPSYLTLFNQSVKHRDETLNFVHDIDYWKCPICKQWIKQWLLLSVLGENRFARDSAENIFKS